MRILVLNYEFPPVGGGASPVSFDIARGYVEAGHEVDIITMGYRGLLKFEVVDGMNVHRVKCLRSKKEICTIPEMMSFILPAFFKAREIHKKKRFDVNHTHFVIPTGIISLLLKWFYHIPFFITSHGSDIPGHNPDRFILLHKLIKPFARKIIKKAECVTSPSTYLKNLMIQQFGQIGKIVHIPIGVDFSKFRPGKKSKIILTAGRAHPMKGFQHVIRAVKDLDSDWELHIAGDGPYLPKLKALARNSKTKVVFHGWVNKKEISKLYSRASIFALISEKENAALVLMEAMAAKCAILTTDSTGCKETAGKAGLLVKFGDVRAIRRAIDKLMGETSRWENLAYERSKSFDIRKIQNRYCKVAEDISKRSNKILMIAPQPFFEPRGTPISIYHRMNALSKLGYNIDLLTYHIGTNLKVDNTKIIRSTRIPWLTNVKIGPSYTKILLDVFIMLKAHKLLRRNKYGYLHTHEEAGVMGVSLKHRYNLPLVYDMHSSMPQQITNYRFSKRKWLINLFARLERWVIQNTDSVIAINPHLKNMADTISPGKTVMIENTATIDTKVKSYDVVRLVKKLGLNDFKTVLYTGTLEINQGLDMLMKTIPLVVAKQKVKFLIVGGNESQIKWLWNLAKAAKADKHIIFTGQVDIFDIPKYIALSDVLVSPRIKGTNTPLKIYQYLKSGKPIVATDIYSHTQVLSTKTAILARPNEKDFAKAITNVLNSPKLQKKLSKNAMVFARIHYDYKQYLEKTRLAYEKAL